MKAESIKSSKQPKNHVCDYEQDIQNIGAVNGCLTYLFYLTTIDSKKT